MEDLAATATFIEQHTSPPPSPSLSTASPLLPRSRSLSSSPILSRFHSPRLSQSSSHFTDFSLDNLHNHKPMHKPQASKLRPRDAHRLLQICHSVVDFTAKYIQVAVLFVGLAITALVQPLLVTFMVLLWIGDEAFKAYFLQDILAVLSLSPIAAPSGSKFELVLMWSKFSFIAGVTSLLVCLVAYLKYKEGRQGRNVLRLLVSAEFINKMKPYFVVYYSAWLLIYWFEITVIFFGYIGKVALMMYGNDTLLEVNAEHNFIGVCFLVLFVILITLADFVLQDIFNLRATPPEVLECHRQE